MGTTTTKTSVLSLQLGQNGSLLNLGLLVDHGGANIDSHGGNLQANASLVPLELSVPALHLNLSTPPIATLAPGGSSSAESAPLTLAGLGVPAALATATIAPAALHSVYASSAAHSTMSGAEVDNLSLVGGALASIDLLSSDLGADAMSTQADGARAVGVGTVKLLDLGALLKGLGVDLSQLPLSGLSSLTSKLGIPLTGVAAGGDLSSVVTSLSGALTNLRQTLVNATTTITTPLDNATQGLLSSLNLPIPSVGSLVSDVNGLITTVQTTLTNLLTGVLSKLDSFPLIQIAGLNVGITTKAGSTLANSAAQVGLSPLQITVAGIALPALDLQSVVNVVNGVLSQANGLLNGLLSTLGLPTNLLSLSLLDKATNVSQNGAYTEATAGLNVLNLKINALDPQVILNDISNLTGPLVSSLLGGTSLSGLLGSTGAMGAINTLLGQTASLLNGAQLQIASLAGASTYAEAALPGAPAAAVPTQLPHTGTDPAIALFGVILAFLSLAVIRWRRSIRLATQRVNDR